MFRDRQTISSGRVRQNGMRSQYTRIGIAVGSGISQLEQLKLFISMKTTGRNRSNYNGSFRKKLLTHIIDGKKEQFCIGRSRLKILLLLFSNGMCNNNFHKLDTFRWYFSGLR